MQENQNIDTPPQDTIGAEPKVSGSPDIPDVSESPTLPQNVQDTDEVKPSPESAEILRMREEINELRREIRVKTEEAKLIKAQLGEFEELFPSVAPEDIPGSVWESVRQGNSLAAAYALHHRRRELRDQKLSDINRVNAMSSSGSIGNKESAEFFTPDEVRAMSQSEVRANYQMIIESMKKWN